jgi:putative FmdB family regulatory protein
VPTYQYACTACGHELEAVQSFTDAALTECPACGGALRKVFSAVGVVFKGSGFYKTDSRASKSAASPAAPSAKSESKSDSGSSSATGSTSSSSSSSPATPSAPAAS